MKQWLETRQVLDRLAELTREGQRAALATVVRVRGSAYRHEGAKMLVAEDGSTTGNVSGGCLEADVREVALRALESRSREQREYCASADEVAAWDLGVGCEGMVEVLVEPIAATDMAVWSVARRAIETHEPFAVCTDLRNGQRCVVTEMTAAGHLDDGVVARTRELLDGGASGIHTVASRDVFIDVFVPPPRLVIVSAGEDARHLARFADEVGFRVIVVDRRPGLLIAERFPSGATLVEARPESIAGATTFDATTYAVVMTHNYADDREYLRAIVGTPCAYIGVLGPRQRTERIVNELGALAPVYESRIYGPVGLDIGTDGAEQVAVSVVAEILAVRSGRRAASLRDRRHPIHADAAD